MHRRAMVLLTLVLLATVALGACGGNKIPTLSDPKEIITKAVEALRASAHAPSGALAFRARAAFA